MTNDDDKKWLYNKLKNQGYNIGTYDEFSSSLNNEEDRKWYYDKASSMKLNVGTYDDFNKMFGTTTTEEAPAAPADTVAATMPKDTVPTNPTEQPAGQNIFNQPQIPIKTTYTQQEWEKMDANQRLQNAGNVVISPEKPWTMEQEAAWSGLTPEARKVIIGDDKVYNMFESHLQHQQAGKLQTANRQQVADLTTDIDSELTRRGAELDRKASEQRSWWQDLPRGGGGAITTFNFSTNNGRMADQEYKDLSAARNQLTEAQRIINEADINAKNGTMSDWLKSSFAGGASRGFGQKLFDVSTWDAGMTDLNNNASALMALKAFDEGKPLTRSQEMLLDAMSVKLATDAYFGSYVGRGYKAGQITAESIPFMIEMCINPASTTGKSATSQLSRYALQRFGKQALKKNAKKYAATKAATRVLGDVAGSAMMSASTGTGRVTADAVDRMTGQVTYDTDLEDGTSYFTGHTEGDDALTAFGKAFASTTIENYSEMVGNYFAPALGMVGRGVRKGMEKIGLGSVGRFIDNVAASDVAKLVTDFEKNSQWNGLIGEYAEEVAGNIMNALVVGDMTLDTAEGTGVFNLDQNIDTFLGVSLMGGFLSSVKTLGYRTPKYRAKKDMQSKDNAASLAFGDQETWGGIRNTLAFGNEEEVKSALNDVLANDSYTEQQKAAALDYAKAVETYRGMVQGESKRREEEDPTQVDTETSFDNGYSLESPQEQNDAKNMLDYQRENMKKLFGMDDVDESIGDPLRYIAEMRELGRPQEEIQTVIDYANAKATYDGMIQHVRDDIDGKIEQSNARIDSYSNETGMIQPATMKVDDRQVYVVNGKIVMNEDGTGIDTGKSDEFIVIRDAQTGNLETTNPHNVLSVDEPIDAASQKSMLADQIMQEEAQKAARQIDGTLSFNPGDTYTLTDEEGKQMDMQVVPNEQGIVDNGDGTVNVTYDGGTTVIPMQKEKIQQMNDATNLARLTQFEQEKAEKRAMEAADEQAASRPSYAYQDELTLKGQDGIGVRGSIVSEMNDDGQFEVYTETPINGKKVNLFTPEELDGMVIEHNGAPVTNEAAQPAQQETEGVSVNDEAIRNATVEDYKKANPNINESSFNKSPELVQQYLQQEVPPTVDYLNGKLSDRDYLAAVGYATGENSWLDSKDTTAEDIAKAAREKAQSYLPFINTNADAGTQQQEAQQQEAPTVEPMPMIGEGENAEPDFASVTPQRSHDYLYNEAGISNDEANAFVQANIDATKKQLEKVKKSAPKMGTSLSAYKKQQQEYQAKVNEAQQKADYWLQVKAEHDKVKSEEMERRRKEQEAATSQAILEEQQRIEEEKRKAEEQQRIGTNNVAPAIRERWIQAPKVEGSPNEIVLANGEKVPGRYVLVESGAATPSHNVANGFAKTEGFPIDENEQSVNDRDYERDKQAQDITRQIAGNYDSRALQTPVVVSNDGIVLSGNGRTMAGEMAAAGNTDAAYIEYLQKYPEQFGFTKEQIAGMKHPRVVFVPNDAMPYTTETFAKFNQQDMKGQSKTEQAVKLGKVVDDSTFNQIVRRINSYDSLGDFYADSAAANEAIKALHGAGVINSNQLAEMFDGETLSASGKELLENLLIGKAFESNPDAVRQITAFKSVRQAVISALSEISNNVMLGKEYSLENELSQAIALVYAARKNGVKAGESASAYARQGNLFQIDEGATVADYNNATVMMLADILNDGRVTRLKRALSVYNAKANDSAQGQMDLFTGSVVPKDEILKFVNQLFSNGTEEQQAAAVRQADERRKENSVQQDVDSGTGNDGNGTGQQEAASEEAEISAEEALAKRVTYTDYEAEKEGPNGTIYYRGIYIDGTYVITQVDEPNSKGEYTGSYFLYGNERFAGIPEAVNYIDSREGDEKLPKHINKDGLLVNEDGTPMTLYHGTQNEGVNSSSDLEPGHRRDDGDKATFNGDGVSFTPSKDIALEYADNNEKKVFSANIRFKKPYYSYGVQGLSEEEAKEFSDRLKSEGYDGIIIYASPAMRAVGDYPIEVISLDKGSILPAKDIDVQIEQARQEVNTSPTEAQIKAGNYRKGHVKIDGFDITIENPKGSVRSGVDEKGNKWSTEMQNDYGYIKGTESVDGDHIDIFLSDHLNDWNGTVYVVDQVTDGGGFDEHKVMYGFNSQEEAREAYLSNYSKGWKGLGSITAVSKDDFRKWVDSSHRKTKPFSEYKSVQATFEKKEKSASGGSMDIVPKPNGKQNGTAPLQDTLPTSKDSEKEEGTQENSVKKEEGFTVERRFHKKNGTYIYAVKFTELMDKDAFKALKTKVKNFGGYYSSFGKGGFIFDNEEDARKFASAVLDKSGEQLYDAEPLSLHDVQSANGDLAEDNSSLIERIMKGSVIKWAELYLKAKSQGDEKNATKWKNNIREVIRKTYKGESEEANKWAEQVFFPYIEKNSQEPSKGTQPEKQGPGMKEIDVISLMKELKEKGEAKLSDHVKDNSEEQPSAQPETKNPSGNRLVTDERYAELRERMRKKLGGQMNMGIDPEILAIGAEMAVYHIEKGARKFSEYAKAMIEDMGDAIRPYLKAFYNGARDLPEMEDAGYTSEMTSYDEVRKFDIANFDKEQGSIMATAEMVVKENQVSAQAEEAKNTLTNQRNEQRRKDNEQTSANTETVASQAEAVASDSERRIEEAETKEQIESVQSEVEEHLSIIDNQLSELDYVDNLRSGMRVILKDGRNVLLSIVMHSGEQIGAVQFSKPHIERLYASYKGSLIEFTPDKIDIEATVRLNEPKEVRAVEPNKKDTPKSYNNYKVGDKVIYTPSQRSGSPMEAVIHDFENYGEHNPVLDTGLAPVLYEVVEWGDIKPISQKSNEKPSKSNEKEVSSHTQIGNLFGDLFENESLNNDRNDTEGTEQSERTSGTDRTVGNVSPDGNGILESGSTGRTDSGETGGSRGREQSVDSGKPGRISSGRSVGNSQSVDNGHSEIRQPESDGGRSVRTGADANGRHSTSKTPEPSKEDEKTEVKTANEKKNPKNTRNYLYPSDASEIDNLTPQKRLEANVNALEVLCKLIREQREATKEEREIMGRFRGWGGLGDILNVYNTRQLRNLRNPLADRLADAIEELDPKENRHLIDAIRKSSLTSYYTPTAVARAMNGFLVKAGFKGGNMLDPSMGSGIFEGTLPKDVQQRTQITGVELDWLTGQIAKHLYPDANVKITGYENANTTRGGYDVVESNIPFGSIRVNDSSWKSDSSPVKRAAQGKIHNYFAVKMLESTRPGGLCVIMTSNAILDTKGNQIIRDHILDQAEVLGVLRLPDNTFKGAGTSVVTDVLFLRKYRDEEDRNSTLQDSRYQTIKEAFQGSTVLEVTNPSDRQSYKVEVNGYFKEHPEMMIGTPIAGGQYRADAFGLISNLSTDEIAAQMEKLIDKSVVGNRKGKLFNTVRSEREVYQAVRESYTGDGSFEGNGNIIEQNGKFGILSSEKNKYGDTTRTFEENPKLKKYADRIRAYIPLRKLMKQIISEEIAGTDNRKIDALRKELTDSYNKYVKKFGRLHDKENDFISYDIDGYSVRSLEIWKEDKLVKLSDIFTKNTIKPALNLSQANDPQSAISISLSEYGEIRPSFMEKVLGENWYEQCSDVLYRIPFSEDRYDTKDAYLSGDVKSKLEDARKAAEENSEFEKNVKALEEVQPKDIPFDDISIRMGARWIPIEVYNDFLYETYGISRPTQWNRVKSGIAYSPEADTYTVNIVSTELSGKAVEWKTERRSAGDVFEAALKDKTLTVYDTYKDNGQEVTVLNKEQTELVNNKIQDLRTAFEDWLPRDPERVKQLQAIYNDKFNRSVLRKFDGSHLNVAGLMGMELRPHQKDAVWMLINNRGGIVDHIVGAGKTLVMQSAIMEMRRMGIAKKPMIVVLKATVAQIAKEFVEAYPAARILAPTEKDFQKENRKKFLANIALNDYDCVIISHDQYIKLPHTEEVETQVINEQLAQLDAAIEFLYGQEDASQLTKRQIKGLEKRKANLEAKLAKLLDRSVDREFTFESMGIDYLFVDECQAFKSLPYVTSYQNVAGLSDAKGSQKSIALLNGIRYLQKLHQGDMGTVFLSGTTITNSLVEIYNLLQYLRPNEMQRLGFTTFDAWASNFALRSAELEYGVTNELKEKNRFRNFDNVPELAKMYAEIADVRNDMNLQLPKPKPRMHIVTVPASEQLKEINMEVVNMVKNKNGSYFGLTTNERSPFGLLASGISTKAAISTRLIDPNLEDDEGKIKYVCENVKKIYDKFNEQKGTQLIFCDTGIPGAGKSYDAYTDIINRLVNEYGIPREEIVDIHVADTDEKRKALFAKVNEGKVRILIGGTKNMGTGVNVQKRIVALHHVDVPWTPADREQREGRGVRQGNEIAKQFNDNQVDIFFYATEGSLDMYKYQLQDTKGKMFTQFKAGTVGERNFDEGTGDAEGGFDPAEIVALLSGNPVIFEKSKMDKKVEKLRRAKRAYESDWQRRKEAFEEAKSVMVNMERLLRLNARDIEALERNGFKPDDKGTYPSEVTVVEKGMTSGQKFDKPKEAGAYIHKLLEKGKAVILKGFGMQAEIGIPEDDMFGKRPVELSSVSGIKYTTQLSDDDTAAGCALRTVLLKVINNKKVYETKLEEYKKQVDGADPGENIFPKQAELDEALKEKKRLDAEYKKLSDENKDSKSGAAPSAEPEVPEEDVRFRIREAEPPKKTGIGYKVFVTKNGKLYPPMVANPNGADTPVGVWLDADAAPVAGTSKTGRMQVKAGGKGTQGGSGKLAYRPGWHIGEIPYALQFNRLNPETGERELFPANFVWAEVEYADDIDYQDEAMSYGYNQNGKFQHSLAGLPRLPENGSYKYRTNPNPETDDWIITGAMKVNRVLKPSEVDAMVEAAGRKPQPRQSGAITDAQVEKLNEQITGNTRQAINDVGKKLNLDIEVIESTENLEGRKAKAKGWFDTRTGKIVLVLPNHTGVSDVMATILHEGVAHQGLRQLFGEHFDTFLDNVFNNVSSDIRRRIVDLAKKNGWNFRVATEEYLAALAEDTNFENAQHEGWWNKVKQFFLRMLAEVGITLPTLTDNELRYILWRSYMNLKEPGTRSIFGQAEDVSMQSRLKVGNYSSTPENGPLRFRDQSADGIARRMYEDATRRKSYRLQEAYQDSMLGLLRMQQAIAEESGEDITDHENAYVAENHMSSRSTDETEFYKDNYFKPMMKAVTDLMKKGHHSYNDVVNYLIAKSGLERNVELAFRDALNANSEDDMTATKAQRDAYLNDPERARLIKDLNDGKISWSDYRVQDDMLRELYAPGYLEFRKKDYSGLTALTGEETDYETVARQMVEEMEQDDNDLTDNVWKAINTATKETLRKTYESGLMSKNQYEYVKGMFEYYIPLRGWKEDTAADVYDYLTSERSSFNSPVKDAKGRMSLADDPLATIGNMAESAILQGNRNLMKQKFLNMVMNHPTSLATVSEMWYENKGTEEDPIWVESVPEIPDDATADEVAAIVDKHEADMNDLRNKGMATKKRGHLTIDYRASKREKQEHSVKIKRNGKDYVVYVNGNPRAAQALNGLTTDSMQHKFMKLLGRVKRQMTANFTTRNPAFVVSNLSRDLIFSGSAVAIKENRRYVGNYTKNILSLLGNASIPRLMWKRHNGTLDMNNPIERYFSEFLRNGGETGYTNLHSVDEYKKLIAREIVEAQGRIDVGSIIGMKPGRLTTPTTLGIVPAFRFVAKWTEFFNRCAEDTCRFAVYMTSRQQGRSVVRSINDAKEITVNFNKKGAGGLGATTFNTLYFFFNAAVQSLANAVRLAKSNPVKFAAWTAGFTAAGILVPMMNQILINALGGDDDKDAYNNLPDWIRRNNLVFWLGGERFLTIPLPIELRAFYGSGELFHSITSGIENKNVGYKILAQFSDLLPLNLTGGGGDALSNVIPGVGEPFYQVMTNTDYFGKPIYKDKDYNKLMPEWTKAYSGTSKQLIRCAELLNELSGGDKYMKGALDINPAVVEHFFESYFGGMGKTVNQLGKGISAIWDEDQRNSRNIPVVNRFYSSSDERNAFSRVNEEYYHYLEEYQQTQQRIRGYENEDDAGVMGYAEKIDFLENSKEYERYEIMSDYMPDIKDLQDEINETEDRDERKDLEMMLNVLKAELIDELKETEK